MRVKVDGFFEEAPLAFRTHIRAASDSGIKCKNSEIIINCGYEKIVQFTSKAKIKVLLNLKMCKKKPEGFLFMCKIFANFLHYTNLHSICIPCENTVNCTFPHILAHCVSSYLIIISFLHAFNVNKIFFFEFSFYSSSI